MSDTRWTDDKQRLLAWALGAVIALGTTVGGGALTVGAWAFHELRGEAKLLSGQAEGLKDSINGLKTEVAVLTQQQREVQTNRAELAVLRELLQAHVSSAGHPLVIERLEETRAEVREILRTRFSRTEGDVLLKRIERLEAQR